MVKRLGDNPLGKNGEENPLGMYLVRDQLICFRCNLEAEQVYEYLRRCEYLRRYAATPPKIARALNMDIPTVVKALMELRKAGKIELRRR